MQAKANTTVDTIKEKEVQRLWGDPNPTDESLARLMLCPPPLLGPLDPKLPKESGAGEPRAPGNASAVGQHEAAEQEPQSPRGSEEKETSHPSTRGGYTEEEPPSPGYGFVSMGRGVPVAFWLSHGPPCLSWPG